MFDFMDGIRSPLRLPATLAVLLLSAVFAIVGCSNHYLTYRIVLPDQYVGWVRVDFAANAPPIVDSKNVMTLRVDEDGTASTNTVMVSGNTHYEFFYDALDGLRPVSHDLVDYGQDAGGITAHSPKPGYGTAWYFFVGSKSYRDQHPNAEFLTHGAPPFPGRMPLLAPSASFR